MEQLQEDKCAQTPIIGEKLVLVPPDDNEHDKHAVTVMKDGCIVKHIPRFISQNSWFLFKYGGHITCCVIGKRQHGVSLEVPCVGIYLLRFIANDSVIANTGRIYCSYHTWQTW